MNCVLWLVCISLVCCPLDISKIEKRCVITVPEVYIHIYIVYIYVYMSIYFKYITSSGVLPLLVALNILSLYSDHLCS